MTISFMIKKKYLKEKVRAQEEVGTFYERRAYKPFWRSRIGSMSKWSSGHREAVFLCGRQAYKAEVLKIEIEETPAEVTHLVGELCYVIECKFHEWDLKMLKLATDEAEKEVYELIKQDFCTAFQTEH